MCKAVSCSRCSINMSEQPYRRRERVNSLGQSTAAHALTFKTCFRQGEKTGHGRENLFHCSTVPKSIYGLRVLIQFIDCHTWHTLHQQQQHFRLLEFCSRKTPAALSSSSFHPCIERDFVSGECRERQKPSSRTNTMFSFLPLRLLHCEEEF